MAVSRNADMERLSVDVSDTFLTERQVEVLLRRNEGKTQEAIASDLGTSVSNISSIEAAANNNIDTARNTLDLAFLLESVVQITVEAGTDLRSVIDEIYRAGDEAGLKISYTEPELATHLNTLLSSRLRGREVSDAVELGLTADGEVVVFPRDEPP